MGLAVRNQEPSTTGNGRTVEIPDDLEPAPASVTALFGDNQMSVAMPDVDSGATATYGHDAFDTASTQEAGISIVAQSSRASATAFSRKLGDRPTA
ncbi:hypothetical protein AB0L50_29375 [Streptomyces flaveolus]|uniref:hypothetical protein n=1 Tax=Streptomyces flaveolus TaxID=67297 RepID=UPI0034427DF9